MDELIQSILRLGAPALASEDAACAALVALRFPDGLVCPRCGSGCTRDDAKVTCAQKHRFTILVGTPFASKLRPRVRALFLAIRAFALSPRSVSARELARDVDMPASTLWRHLQTLRSLLPPPQAHPTQAAASVQLCGKRTRAFAASVRAGARTAIARTLDDGGGGAMGRLVGESVRTLVNGTFRGVSARWLPAYLDETRTRWRVRARMVEVLVERLLTASSPSTFDDVRRHFGV